MSAESSFSLSLPVLGGLAWKSLIVFLVAGTALFALRCASAAARHLVCLLTLASLLVLPILSLALPGWRLAVLSAPQSGEAGNPPRLTSSASPPGTGRVGVLKTAEHLTSSPLPVGEGGEERAGRGSSVAAPHPFPWTFALSVLWLSGFLVAGLRPLLGLWGIARLSHDSEPVADSPTLALASKCASVLGLPQTPTLRQAVVPVPMTWGWCRPVVLLPAETQNWPDDCLRAVLLHELAHVRRRDWLFHRFADFVCALYWFHPLVWLVARRLRLEGEIACDDLVLTSGVAAPDYARHLLDVAHALHSASAVPQSAIAMAHTSRIERRLKMILNTARPRRVLTRRALLLALGLSAAAIIPLAVLRPGARVQAAAPPPASPRHLTTLPVTSATPTRVVAGGIPVQLVYVTPLANITGDSGALLPSPRQRRVLFTFRIPTAAQDVTVKYDLTDCLFSASTGTWQSKMRSTSHLTEAQLNPQTNGSRLVTATFTASVSKTNIRVGTASGPWTKAAGQAPTRYAGSSVTTPNGTFIFSQVTPEKGNVWGLKITTGEQKQDIRVVAVNAKGRELLPSTIGDTTAGGLDQITARFADLPLPQIKEFRVETRPFQWVEFKDVALQPSGTPVASSDGTDTATRRLQQIYSFLQAYQRTHSGMFPPTSGPNNLFADMAAHPQAYGLLDQGDGNTAQAVHFFHDPNSPLIAYFLHNKRPDGTLVGTAKQAGTRDILAYTNSNVRNSSRGADGFYLVLWDDGTVGSIPAGKILTVPAYDVIGSTGAAERAARQGEKQIAFPGQSGLPRI